MLLLSDPSVAAVSVLGMGNRVNATPTDSANACSTAARGIPESGRLRRDVLGEALTGAGMVNYPPAW